MFSFKSIYGAYKKCRKHKRSTLNALNFEANLLQNIWNLEEELKSRNYHIGKSICFLASSPKLREIFAADFRDRVVHHILIKQLEPFYEKKFVYDVYNNRKGKGIHMAVKRTSKFMKVTKDSYFLQLDIKGFFYNIDKNILFKQLFNDIDKSNLRNKKEILWLSNKIIYHDPTKNYNFKGDKRALDTLPEHKTLFRLKKHKGIPTGNLTSQFFANVYLNRFDHFVKRVLKIKYYIRYVDDFVLIHTNKERLQECKVGIQKYLKEHLALELRADSRLKKVNQGLDFLGYIIRPNYRLVRKRVISNYKYKKANYLDEYESLKGKMGLEEIKDFLSVQASFVGHCSHANSYNLTQQVGVLNENNPFDYDRT